MRFFGPHLSRLVALVLLSAAGLVAFGLLGLEKTAQEAQDLARLEAHRTASNAAKSFLQRAQSPGFLDQVPALARFDLDEYGSLVIPQHLKWIDAQRFRDSQSPPSWLAKELVGEAQKMEFGDGNGEGALAYLRGRVAKSDSPEDQAFLTARAAWVAHRIHDETSCEALLEDLFSRGTLSLANQGAAHRLATLRSKQISPLCLAYLQSIPQDDAQAFFDRMGTAEIKGLEEARGLVRDGAEHRLRLRVVARNLEACSQAQSPLFLEGSSDLVLAYFPSGREGSGVGCVLPPADLGRLVGHEDVAIHFGINPPVDAIGSLPLISFLPRELDEGPSQGKKNYVPIILAAVSLSFILGLFLTLRAVRRESVAAAARSDFLTSVTHELKTPLASIRLLAEMLENKIVTDEDRQQEYFRLLSGESVRLSVLLENVLDLGRMERGERAYDKRPVYLDDTVAEAVSLFAPLAEKDGMTISVDLNAPDATAEADQGALVQVLLNVLENGKKYSEGNKSLAISSRFQAEGVYSLDIRDFGPGIEAADRERIFERFIRGAKQAHGGIPGVGLGLYLSRRIMQDHHGDLRCIEPPGDSPQGALFRLTLPARNSHGN